MNSIDTGYLNLLDRHLDDQQITVCCSSGNTIVAAGAGSGKTHVLATRFACLVMTEDISVDKILTLTFTDKAASEMYERIYGTLSFFAANEKTPEPARSRAQKALADFSSSHIQTLDSYCAAIVRQCANRYGIRPDFSIGTSGAVRTIKRLALPFVLTHRNEKALQTIAEAGKLQEVSDLLFADTVERYTSLASERNFFTGALAIQKKEILSAWNECICAFNDSLEYIRGLYADYPDEKKAKPYYSYLKDALAGIDGCGCQGITAESIESGTAAEPVSAFIRAVRGFYFSQTTAGFTPELRSAVGQIKKEAGPALENAGEYISNYKTIERIYELLDEFLAEVNEAKRQTGELTFFDVTELSLRILKEQDDIRSQESSAYERIMIDEFQDNNGKNRELLNLIARNNLFFVGDEKQSIYKFRGADVSVFTKLKDEISSEGGNVYSMIYNYRSSPELLASFNQIFGGYCGDTKIAGNAEDSVSAPAEWIFPEKPQNAYEAGFSDETVAKKYNTDTRSAEKSAHLTRNTVPMHVCMLNTSGVLSGDDADSYLTVKDQLAYFIAEKISLLHDSGVPYNTIAVLDRSRTDRSRLVKFFSKESIPYIVDQHKDLFAEAPVNDIYNLLRLCVYPSDMNAFAAFICSPFAGLDEQSAETVLAVTGDTENDEFVFHPFPDDKKEDIKNELSSSEYEKYEDASKLYAEFSQYVPSHRISDTITRLWYECGYRYELLSSRSSSLFAEQYDLLFELARQSDSDGKSAAWFVDQLEQKKNGGAFFSSDDSDINTDEVTYPMEDRDAVQVMTIHKSKGLQFAYVFIYGCTGKPRSDSNGDKVYYSDTYGVSLNFHTGAGNYFYERQKADSNAKNEAEFRRLIYVAATRAEKAVYIVGDWERPKSGNTQSSIFEKIIEFYYADKAENNDESGESTYTDNAPFDYTAIQPAEKRVLWENRSLNKTNSTPEEKQKYASILAPLYENAASVVAERVPLNRIVPSMLELSIPEEPAPAPIDGDAYSDVNAVIERTKFSYAQFGTLVHAYLEAFAAGTPPEQYVPLQVYLSGMEKEKDCTIIKNACIKMVNAFAQSSLGLAFAQAKTDAMWYRTEYAFRSFESERYVTGSIDLIFKNKIAADSYTIVDYKTDKVARPELYYNQQALYRKAAGEILRVSGEQIHSFLYYLRLDSECDITSALDAITADELAEEIKKIASSTPD
jgi:ATP-dependent exoDNAse (exonuclease V) beta subunit